MAEDLRSVLVIGGGLGGFTTVQSLRQRGFEGAITLIDPEGLPYDRPPLSKEYLLGQADADKIAFQPEQWYRDHDITLFAATATAIDPDTGTVQLSDGSEHRADRIVLATGGHARTLPIPGAELPGVLVLRTRADADALRARITPGSRTVVVGAGLIGAEVASAIGELGGHCTLVDPADPPLAAALGDDAAAHLHAMHRTRGVDVVTGAPSEIAVAGGHLQVAVSGGAEFETITADTVLIGVGITAATELAESAGLRVDRGIVVDDHQQTSHPAVYAVGDVARTAATDGTLLPRSEHWENAMRTGDTAAAALLSEALPEHGAPWFWSDRHQVHVEAVGSLTGPGEIVLRRDADQLRAVFRIDGDHLLGAVALDDANIVRAARRIIDRDIPVSAQELADPAIPLKKLTKNRRPTEGSAAMGVQP